LKRKDKIISGDGKVENREEMLRKLNGTILQNSISIEILLRNFFSLLHNENNHLNEEKKKDLSGRILDLLFKGASFELIDGDSLTFQLDFLKQLVKSSNNKMFVVSILGKQSSGKSTMLNYSLGTQFITGNGRQTSGLFITFQELKDGPQGTK